MKKIVITLSLISSLLITPAVLAAPTNPNHADNNQTVAYYTSGIHTIVGEQNDIHTGTDLVTQSGSSGNFQQWFTGTSDEGTHGDHSVWNSVGSQTSCPSGWQLIPNANQSWGDYLKDGNYCVKTNDFSSK